MIPEESRLGLVVSNTQPLSPRTFLAPMGIMNVALYFPFIEITPYLNWLLIQSIFLGCFRICSFCVDGIRTAIQ